MPSQSTTGTPALSASTSAASPLLPPTSTGSTASTWRPEIDSSLRSPCSASRPLGNFSAEIVGAPIQPHGARKASSGKDAISIELDDIAVGERRLDLHERSVRIAAAARAQESAATRQIGDVLEIQRLAFEFG